MIYIYQHREPFITVKTLKEAAQETHVSTTTVSTYLKTGMVTKKGFFFSHKPIPKEQRHNIPDNDQQLSKNGIELKMDGKCRRMVDDQEYEVNSRDGLVTYIPTTKQERIETLARFIARIAKDRWRNIPRSLATLEKQFTKELIDSLT